MDYLKRSFRSPANSKQFKDNWDAVFGNKDEEEEESDRLMPGNRLLNKVPEYNALFYKSYKEYLEEPRVRERHDEVFRLIRDFYAADLDSLDVVDLGCGLGEFRGIPDQYYGVDRFGHNPGTNLVLDYRRELPSVESIGFEPTAIYSGFSIECCTSKEESHELYESIFDTYPSVQFIFSAGFYYSDKRKNEEIVREVGGIQSFQTLDNPEDVTSDKFSEVRVSMKAPSNMFGEDVVEVWKILRRK